MQRFGCALGAFLILLGGLLFSRPHAAQAEDKPTGEAKPAVDAKAGKRPLKTPMVEGKWTGTWGIYSPAAPAKEGAEAKPKSVYERAQMRLDCAVEQKDGKWQATFEGECGRPYKYQIKMLGRQAGGAVLFQGTADLGPMDGGVFDWIGRATDKEFVGFYTSQGYTGTFQMSRVKE